jgi:hypothetical protein
MLVIIDLKTIFHKYFVRMIRFNFRTKFHILIFSGPLIIALKVKDNVRTAAMFLFYILQKKCHNKGRIFFEDPSPYITSWSNIKWR